MKNLVVANVSRHNLKLLESVLWSVDWLVGKHKSIKKKQQQTTTTTTKTDYQWFTDCELFAVLYASSEFIE